jgi:hypothetical protein
MSYSKNRLFNCSYGMYKIEWNCALIEFHLPFFNFFFEPLLKDPDHDFQKLISILEKQVFWIIHI